MKKLLIILAVLLVLAIAALGIFIATFDANHYRPLLVKELSKTLGRPVEVADLSLRWDSGIALRVGGVTVPDEPASAEPLLQLEEARALIRFAPLLRKELQVASVVLRKPQIRVRRDAQGRMNLEGLAVAGAPAAAAAPPSSERGVSFKVDSFRIEGGQLHWTDAAAVPPQDLRVNALDVTVTNIAPGQSMDVEAAAAFAATAQNVRLSGRVLLPQPPNPGAIQRLSVKVDGLALEGLMPVGPAGEPRVRGLFSVELAGALPTLDPAQLARTASGEGRLRLSEVVLENVNILREVFAQLSVVPGLSERLQSRLPPEYQQRFEAKDTPLGPLDIPFSLAEGRVSLPRLDVRSDTFRLSSSGTFGLGDKYLSLKGTIAVEPTLSAAVISSVNELQALTNADGDLELPLTVEGQLPHITPRVDAQYILKRVIRQKATDFLQDLLQPKEEEPQDPEQEPAPDAPSAPEAPAERAPQDADLLGTFLRRALEKESSPP